MSLEWIGPVPRPHVDLGSFQVKIWRPSRLDGSPLLIDPTGELSVDLWMPGMGHGSDPILFERRDVGSYLASEVFFNMGNGLWQIRFILKQNGVEVERAISEISFAEP